MYSVVYGVQSSRAFRVPKITPQLLKVSWEILRDSIQALKVNQNISDFKELLLQSTSHPVGCTVLAYLRGPL